MGVPFKKIAQVGLAISGVAGADLTMNKEMLETEVIENQILTAILREQQLTNKLLLQIIADNMGEEEFDEFVKELGA